MHKFFLLLWLASASAGLAQAEDCSVQGAAAQASPERVIALDPGARDRIERRRGELKSASDTMVFALDITEATGVRIDVEGNDFDPAVELCRAEAGRILKIDENFDGPRSLNPQLDAFLEPGRWLVVVKSEALAGPFTLLVRQTDDRPLAEAPATPIKPGETLRGKIRSEPNMSVTVKDRYRLPVEAGRAYLVTARSDSFDTILWVRDPSATARAEPLAQDDDGWDGLNSALGFTAPRTGDVIIEVGDNNGRGGAYEVAVRALHPPPANPPALADGTITLSMNDARAPVADGLPMVYRLFTVSGNAGERVRVEAEGDAPVVLHALAETPLGLRSVASSRGISGRGRQQAGPTSLSLGFQKAGDILVLVGIEGLPSVQVRVELLLSRGRDGS